MPSFLPAGENDALNAICSLPQDVGPCLALIPRWSYDTARGQCVEFNYGGCGGNANNFEAKEDCEAQCEGMHLIQ